MHMFLALRRMAVCGGMVCLLAAMGCASGKPWMPFQDQKKAAREREKYGLTADERIKQLAADAKQAKAGSTHEQNAFTQALVATVLAEHDPRVRAKILEIAAGFDTASATAICKGALEDPEPRVRMAACSAWAKRGGPEAVQLLAARYQADTELDVRMRALRELGTLGDKQAIPVLARARGFRSGGAVSRGGGAQAGERPRPGQRRQQVARVGGRSRRQRRRVVDRRGVAEALLNRSLRRGGQRAPRSVGSSAAALASRPPRGKAARITVWQAGGDASGGRPDRTLG